MALVLKDRVKESATSPGTGSVTLLGAAVGFQAFSVIGNTNTCYYTISDQGGPNWEVGIGTYSTTGPTLARTTVLASSNAGSLTNFNAGTQDVFVTYPSERGVWLDASGNAIGLGTPAAFVGTNITGTASGLSIGGNAATATTAGTVTTNANLTGPITSVGNATSIASQTGTGTKFVMDTSPTITGATLTTAALNGTLGATTPSTVVATTLSATGTITHTSSTSANNTGFNSTTSGTFANYNIQQSTGGILQYGLDDSAGSVFGTQAYGSLWNAPTSFYVQVNGTNVTKVTSSGYTVTGDLTTTGNTILGNASTDTLNVGNGDLIKDASGNVGIGVTPSAWSTVKALQIGTSSMSCVGDELFFSSNAYYNAGWKYGAGTHGPTQYYQYAGQHQWFNAASGTAGNAITFTQAMTLDASGNLGIGTASPATKLDVLGVKNSSIASISASLSTVGGASFVDYSELLFKNTAAVNGDSSIRSYSNVWAQAGSILAFFTNSSSALTERMRITSTGFVGIGKTPTVLLDIYNVSSTEFRVSNLAHGFQLYTDDTGTTLGTYTADPLVFRTNATERMRIHSTGGVSIGNTTDPGATNLSVTGLITANGGVSGAFNGTLGATTPSTVVATTIDGTTSIRTTNTFEYPALGSMDGAIKMLSTSGVYGLFGGVSSGGYSWLQTGRNDANATAYTLYLNNQGGDVNLASNKVIASSTGLAVTGTTTSSSFIPNSATAPVNGMYLPAANTVGFTNNSTERLRIGTTGGVATIGIDTTTAGASLQINDFGATGYNGRALNVNGSSALFDGAGQFDMLMGDGGTAYMSIQTTDNATDMKIRNASGNADLVSIARTTGIVTMHAYGAGAATFSAAGVISSVSDETWKIKDGIPLNPDVMLKKLTPGYWYYNAEKAPIFGAERQLGFYAQNVNYAIGVEAAPIPETYIETDENGTEITKTKPWGYYDRSVLAVTVLSLQKALATIDSLTSRIEILESK